MPQTENACPCHSGKPYSACCQPFHTGTEQAANAEQLMRSRYAAFRLGLIDYLIETLHPSQRQPDDAVALQETIENTVWLGLKVIKSEPGADNEAFVEFVAFYEDEGIAQLHERSRFVREDGRWYYLDGSFLPPVKLGRNDPCVCGSGKKLKRCHG